MPTRERIKELLPVLQAYAEGKTIEFKDKYSHPHVWNSTNLVLGFKDGYDYRIKSEPQKKYIVCSINEQRKIRQ